jgi:hypothetical protein
MAYMLIVAKSLRSERARSAAWELTFIVYPWRVNELGQPGQQEVEP